MDILYSFLDSDHLNIVPILCSKSGDYTIAKYYVHIEQKRKVK